VIVGLEMALSHPSHIPRGEETGEIVGLEMALFHLSQIPLRERNSCDSEAMKMALLNPLT
jgi:hypothetical protein